MRVSSRNQPSLLLKGLIRVKPPTPKIYLIAELYKRCSLAFRPGRDIYAGNKKCRRVKLQNNILPKIKRAELKKAEFPNAEN